jgi:hypothetical protein
MPPASGTFQSNRFPSLPASGAADQAHERSGKQVQTGLAGADAEAVVDEACDRSGEVAGGLDEIGDQDERAQHREAARYRDQVRQQHRPVREHSHVDHRLGYAQLDDPPGDAQDDGSGEQPDDGRRAPAPVLALGQREQQRDERAREEQRAGDVDPRRRLDRRLGHEQVHEHDGDRDADRADDEEPAPRGVVDDHAREHEPERAADREHRGDDPDRGSHPFPRELVLDDREAEREDGAARALDHAADR